MPNSNMEVITNCWTVSDEELELLPDVSLLSYTGILVLFFSSDILSLELTKEHQNPKTIEKIDIKLTEVNSLRLNVVSRLDSVTKTRLNISI